MQCENKSLQRDRQSKQTVYEEPGTFGRSVIHIGSDGYRMRWLKAQKLWSEPASQREWDGKGGVELFSVPRTVPVWDVLSHSLSPPRFWVCPPFSEPTPFIFVESSLPKDG